MLITIEGPSCSGKSTICTSLKTNLKDCLIVGRSELNQPLEEPYVINHPELSFDQLTLEEPNHPMDQLHLQIRFAHIISRRLRFIQQCQARVANCLNKDDTIILADRDISSFYAHTRARLYETEAFHHGVIAEIIRYVWSQYPIVPHLFIYVQTPYEVCLERSRTRMRPIRRELLSAHYFQLVSEGYQNMIKVRGEDYSLILDGLECVESNVEKILKKIESTKKLTPQPPVKIINDLADTLRKVK